MSRTIVFYDTEFTTWEGAIERDWTGPGEYRELVQIGAVRFDLETLEGKEEFSVFIKPVKNPELSDYFIELTGITQEQVNTHGLHFSDAYNRLLDFAQNQGMASYGWDHSVIRENQGFNDKPPIFTGFDIRPWFQYYGAEYGIHSKINSGRLAETLGLNIDSIQEHNALHDVRSICAAYRFLVQNGANPAF